MTRFRPCIDLHRGRVKQIVGSTLTDDEDSLKTNSESANDAAWFARRYRRDGLRGGHVIKLGPGNEAAALAALAAYPGGLQVGGGITPENAATYLSAGASHVIVTSYLFPDGQFSEERLKALNACVGASRLVIDLSCRRVGCGEWAVVVDRWQTLTALRLTHATLDALADACAEFLVHAADIEGQCEGIDEDLVRHLGAWGRKPVTYAGGARSISDLYRVAELSNENVDLTIGSALDIFGGHAARYEDCVAFNRRDRDGN